MKRCLSVVDSSTVLLKQNVAHKSFMELKENSGCPACTDVVPSKLLVKVTVLRMVR